MRFQVDYGVVSGANDEINRLFELLVAVSTPSSLGNKAPGPPQDAYKGMNSDS